MTWYQSIEALTLLPQALYPMAMRGNQNQSSNRLPVFGTFAAAESSTSTENVQSPFFLHNEDHLGLVLVSHVLT